MVRATVVVFEIIFVASKAPARRHPRNVILQNAIKRMRPCGAPDPGNGHRFLDTHISLASQNDDSHRNEALAATIIEKNVFVGHSNVRRVSKTKQSREPGPLFRISK